MSIFEHYEYMTAKINCVIIKYYVVYSIKIDVYKNAIDKQL